MKKKALLASVIALATASAMSFAPVSYKVIDKAYANSQEQTNADKIGNKLNEVFAQMTAANDSTRQLRATYEAAVKVVEENYSQLDIETQLPNLLAINHNDIANQVAPLEESLSNLISLAIQHYGSPFNTNGTVKSSVFDTVPAGIQAEIKVLNGILGTEITVADVADFAYEIKDRLYAELEAGTFDPIDFIQNGNITTEAKQFVEAQVRAEWAAGTGLISHLKEFYNDNLDLLLEDVNTAIDSVELTAAEKRTLQVGAAALAVSYAKHVASKQTIFEANPERDGKIYTLKFADNELYDSLLKYAGLLSYETTSKLDGDSRASYVINDNPLEDNYISVNMTSYNGATLTVNAVLDKAVKGIPEELHGVVLFSVKVNNKDYTSPSGGGIIDIGDLKLVSSYESIANSIPGIVDQFLAANPELYNNTLKFALQGQIEDAARKALLVQSAAATQTNDGVTKLNLTPAQLQFIYEDQLATVLNAIDKALEDKDLNLAVNPTLTFNAGVTSNLEVSFTKALIDSLISKKVANVGVKTGDAVVELNLSQLKESSIVKISKSASILANAKSDVYSIDVVDSEGNSLSAFEKQYRVTLPVNGTGANVTVAKLTDGALTYVGGNYDAASNTITFYTNELADYVVVENQVAFNDIANVTWAKDNIQKLANLGLLQGKGNGTFDPQGNVTRAEFTAMLVRAFNLNEQASVSFTDVASDAWYHDAVAAARAYGIVNGRTATTFDPGAQISREEMASMASNALKEVLGYVTPANTLDLLGRFNDAASISPSHTTNVAFIANEGVVQGKGNDNYDPKGNASRAEAATILANLLDRR